MLQGFVRWRLHRGGATYLLLTPQPTVVDTASFGELSMSEESIKSEIARLEERRCHALRSGDVETLANLVADDLQHVHGSGKVDNKIAYLDGVATKYRFNRIERGELNIRVYGDIAVVIGPLSQTVSTVGVEGVKNIEAITTQVWRRVEDGWKQNTCQNQFIKVA